MKTMPMPVRLDGDLRKLLREGALRTPHKKQDLIRMTLRRHLRGVIEEESLRKSPPRITNVAPWPNKTVATAYRRIGKEWDLLEDAATQAQGEPDFND